MVLAQSSGFQRGEGRGMVVLCILQGPVSGGEQDEEAVRNK